MATSSGDSGSTVRIGIIGAAAIAKKNALAITAAPGMEVVAVGSRSAEKAAAWLQEVGLAGRARACTYQQVLDDPAVDAVYLPLPTSLHVDWVKRAAAARKHILLEKPIALTAADTDEIVATCARAGVQFMDGTMWLHNPRTARLQAALPQLGDLRTVTAAFTFNGMANTKWASSDVRLDPGLDALGALGDVGWYTAAYSLWAFGHDPPATVTTLPGPRVSDKGVLLHVGATLLWPDGRRAMWDCGFDTALRQWVEVAGTDGTVYMRDAVIPRRHDQAEFQVTREHGFADYDTRETTLTDAVTVNLERPQEVNMWLAFAECVRKCKAGGPPDARWPTISALTQKVLCAVAESAANGCSTVKFKP